MKRFGQPTMALHIWGDWYTVIGVREYRDRLLDQKPDSEDDADYYCYRLPCNSTAELVAAYNAFAAARLKCAFCLWFESEDKLVTVSAMTGDGWGADEPHCDVQIKGPSVEQVTEERDDLRSALCVARENARRQLSMTLQKFAALCGRSPTWISRWTSSDTDTPPDLT